LEKKIREAARIITGGMSMDDLPAPTELTKCALDISAIAYTALRGELREIALKIAAAIVDYEDALNMQQ